MSGLDDLLDEGGPGPNTPEFTVSEISGALKRVIEGEFGRVRVRGEVGRVFAARSGHLYFDIKDERNVLASVAWKGQVAGLAARPEEGMEVIATGRLTTFGSQSKYQLTVDDLRPAGVGALMAMLEKRKRQLEAEGLFDAARKKPLPFLPKVIGVVTSPSGAVIRDILHRLADRFPRKVLVWPVAVQGQASAPQVARAIEGFNALTPDGAIPRPDLIIVARGGGSIEDLWGFNEEIVARAAAASDIPLISAVGHETDTTLIDYVSDHRAPTPSAAAERAVPVRLDLLAWTDGQGARLARAAAQAIALRDQRLRDLGRALPRPQSLTGQARQRLDHAEMRLPAALKGTVAARRSRLAEAAAVLRPQTLSRQLAGTARQLAALETRLQPALGRGVAMRRERLAQWQVRLAGGLRRGLAARSGSFTPLAKRLVPSLAERRLRVGQDRLETLSRRLSRIGMSRLEERRARLAALDRLRETLGYRATLRRGYAVVRADGALVTRRAEAEGAKGLEIEFADGRLQIGTPRRKSTPKSPPPEQGSLL
ncbi:exodeoxyribonuclease VII large subunit [Profundibacterium mesophilum]|uniref:Exodeoxyribonuclease 7 large subunit n=1 Tax=Profundibacterium mesophilum KAUST100406-0324 TaxID=1037889 RepID=A0A921NPK6_9RHOB|nr:exodeoxyribonuclease VII large subunit [Profundibacterium mesophilum]KAF0676131.1 Exodeoxyribonuclease 7 large subunit [Profundibacterium mesophilum KAUST100406-0324]